MLGDVNKLFILKSLLTMPGKVLPFHLKQTFLPIIWIFTECIGDQIESRLPFKIFYTLLSSLVYLEFLMIQNHITRSDKRSPYFVLLLIKNLCTLDRVYLSYQQKREILRNNKVHVQRPIGNQSKITKWFAHTLHKQILQKKTP